MSVFGARGPRRLLTWLLIAQQLFVGTGVALPCYAEAKSSKERFPCENCRCGCHSAEQCWRACCCYTNAEKVAWARENGVAVPDYVVTAAKQEEAAAAKPKCPHCDQHVGRQAKACSTPAGVGADCRRAGNPTHREPGICWLDVERCHGLTSYMQMAGPTWPGDPSLELRRVLPSLGRIVPQPFPAYLFTPADPPTPPPKLS